MLDQKMPTTPQELADFITNIIKTADPKMVFDFHRQSDFDKQPESFHHTLGPRRGQAADGAHNHDGTTSVPLLPGVVFSGSTTTATAAVLKQVCQALTKIGAADTTT